MKWIKATERLPEYNQQYCLRLIGSIRKSGFLGFDEKFITECGGYKYEDVEWLDEAEPSTPKEPEAVCSHEAEKEVCYILNSIQKEISDLKEQYELLESDQERGWNIMERDSRNFAIGLIKKYSK